MSNDTMQELSKKGVEELMEIKGISQITAQRIAGWFGDFSNMGMAMALIRAWGCDASGDVDSESDVKRPNSERDNISSI